MCSLFLLQFGIESAQAFGISQLCDRFDSPGSQCTSHFMNLSKRWPSPARPIWLSSSWFLLSFRLSSTFSIVNWSLVCTMFLCFVDGRKINCGLLPHYPSAAGKSDELLLWTDAIEREVTVTASKIFLISLSDFPLKSENGITGQYCSFSNLPNSANTTSLTRIQNQITIPIKLKNLQ